MKLNKLTYKITFKKSQSIVEICIAVAIVTAMLIIFTNMAIMVSKAFTMVSSFSGQNVDMTVAIDDEESAYEFYKALHSIPNYKYSHFRTESISLVLTNEPVYAVDLSGAEGDYLEIYEFDLLEGRKPENDFEIIISNDYLKQLNKGIVIGDVISLSDKKTELDEESNTYEFTVVGIFKAITVDPYHIEAYTTVRTMDNLYDDMYYSVAVGTVADKAKELQKAWDEESSLLSQTIDMKLVSNYYFNQSRYDLLNDKVVLGGGLSAIFHFIAAFITVGSMFMIYNIISSSIHKRINDYGLLRSLGCSLSDVSRNFVNVIIGTVMIGGAFGCVLGFVLNHTIGRFLVGKMVGSFDSIDSFSRMVFKDYPTAYVEAILFATIAVIAANAVIWKKSAGLSIVNQIKYGEESNSFKNVKKYSDTKKYISLLGNRNIKRNKISTRCSFLNFFFVGLILTFVIFFFVNLDFRDFNIYKKAEFCDYEVEYDWMNSQEEILLNENELNAYKTALQDSRVYGILQKRLAYNSLDSDGVKETERNFLLLKGVTNFDELSDEEKRELKKQTGVTLYIADDEIIKEFTGKNKKYDYSKPLVFIVGEKKEGTLNIWDANDNCYSLNVDGFVDSNYLRDYSYDNKYDLILNFEAAKEYLDINQAYSGFLVKTELNEEEFKDSVNLVSEDIGKEAIYSSSFKGRNETLDQGKCIMFIALYLVACFFVMVLSNVICTMRVTLNKRKKEFGILVVLGMIKKDVVKLLSFESKKICRIALLISVPFGAIISAYFVVTIGYSINIFKSILGLISSFMICYLATLLTSYLVGNSLLSNTSLVSNMEEE